MGEKLLVIMIVIQIKIKHKKVSQAMNIHKHLSSWDLSLCEQCTDRLSL